MPKSTSQAAWISRRREQGRKAGLCSTCCKRMPASGRRICEPCKASAYERTKRRRAAQRQLTELQQVAHLHERAGDIASDHHLHEDAAQHYEDALNVEGITSENRLRISEKLAYAFSLSGNPHAASPLFDHALVSYLDKPAQATKAVEILWQKARQLWIDARMETALPLLEQAIQIAKKSGDAHLYKISNSKMANYLLGLARYEEAASFLQAAGEVNDNDDAPTRATYYTQRAIIAAVYGNISESFRYFDQAISAAQQDPDVINIITVWIVYATWAGALGKIELEKTYCEQALLVARRYHVIWLIPQVCLEYSGVLFNMGHYAMAHEYLLDALSYDAQTPFVEMSFASTGIPVALQMKDETTLARCSRPSAIDFAFRSGQGGWIGSISAAFAQWHAAFGRERDAAALLHRAVVSEQPAWNNSWDFSIAVARYGPLADAPRVRTFLEERALLPCADVVLACLSLFDAFVAQRRGNAAKMRNRWTLWNDLGNYVGMAMKISHARYFRLRGSERFISLKISRLAVCGLN